MICFSNTDIYYLVITILIGFVTEGWIYEIVYWYLNLFCL
jgi:hypothetical protein